MNTINNDVTKVGNAKKPYVVAEMSGNHNDDINRAITLNIVQVLTLHQHLKQIFLLSH